MPRRARGPREALVDAELEIAMAALVSASVVEPGGTIHFVHPVLRAAIYGDLSSAERERLHRTTARILWERQLCCEG